MFSCSATNFTKRNATQPQRKQKSFLYDFITFAQNKYFLPWKSSKQSLRLYFDYTGKRLQSSTHRFQRNLNRISAKKLDEANTGHDLIFVSKININDNHTRIQ